MDAPSFRPNSINRMRERERERAHSNLRKSFDLMRFEFAAGRLLFLMKKKNDHYGEMTKKRSKEGDRIQ